MFKDEEQYGYQDQGQNNRAELPFNQGLPVQICQALEFSHKVTTTGPEKLYDLHLIVYGIANDVSLPAHSEEVQGFCQWVE